MSEELMVSVRLGEIAHVEMGQSPDSRFVYDDPFLGYPFLQGNAEFGPVFPEPKYGCTRPTKLAKTDDVLISVRAPVGSVNVADRDFCIGRGLAAIRFRGMKPSLAAELLLRQNVALRRVAQGTTFEAINKSDLLNLNLQIPDSEELPTIAKILDTLDTAIRETEAIIAKLKAVKQGLLHDLLTRGIDANGELRPPQSEAPHLYKRSLLGWIPKDWDVVTVESISTNSVIGPFGSDLVAADYRNEGVPVVFVRDIKPNRFEWKSNVFVNSSKAKSLSAHEVCPGDVVATKMGFPPCIAAVYPVSMPNGIVTADIVRLRLKLDSVRSDWMALFMNSQVVIKQVEQITAGVTRPKVTLRDVRNLMILLPNVEEQDRILERFRWAELRIQNEEGLVQKLSDQKSALMNDLLTGHVRVTPLLELS